MTSCRREQQGTPREIRIAHRTVGHALCSLGRYDEAIAIQRENLLRTAQQHDRDGYILEKLGESLLALGWIDEARPQFSRALEPLSPDSLLAGREPESIRRLNGLAGTEPDA